MSANYKNWVPNGMMTALTAGTAGAGCVLFMTVLMKHTETMAACALQPVISGLLQACQPMHSMEKKGRKST